MPKYPDVEVKLAGEDGNSFSILGRVQRALREAGVAKEEIETFMGEAMSGDYSHLIRTVGEWVTIA